MLNNYVFKDARLTCGQRKSESVHVEMAIDIQDDDPYGPPPPQGHYQNGFACVGRLTLEWGTSNQLYFKKLLEGTLVLMDDGDSTTLKIVLLDFIDAEPCLPGALPGQPCRTKRITWSFICPQKPLSDRLGLFPEAIKRQVMKVFVFSRFPGFWNSTQTTAVVTALTRQQAIESLKRQMEQRGLAPLQEGGYSLLELDPTKAITHIVTDGSD